MRVLHVVTLGELGGAQRYVAELARRQRRCGVHVELACGRGGWVWEQRDSFVMVHELRDLVRDLAPVRDGAALLALASVARRGRYDVVHTHSSKAGVLGRLAARIANVRLVAHTSHGTPLAEAIRPLQRAVYWSGEQAAALVTHRLFAVSETERKILARSLWTRPGALRVMTIVPAHIRALPRAWDPCRASAHDLVAIGNLYLNKGYDVLLEALALLAPKHPRMRLTIWGEGPERRALEIRAARLGLQDRVRLPGPLAEVAPEIARAGIFVMPSRKEGLPLALLEAMATGAPIVACDVGAVREALGPRVPLARAGDPRDLARLIDHLLEDDARRRAIVDATVVAYERLVERDDPARTAEMYA